MKKFWKLLQVVLLAAIGMAFVAVLSCGGDDGGTVVTYTATDVAGKEYALKVTDNATYELLIDGVSISTGKVAKNGDVFTLTANADNSTFKVTVERNNITKFEGSIKPDDGGAAITPGDIVEVEPIAGVWTWVVSDDRYTDAWKATENGTKQTVFEPGGVSRITNAVEDSTDKNEHGDPTNRPFVYTTTVLDNEGKAIEGPVFNFKGNTKVTSEGRPANQGAGWPQVGWEAVPDAATLELLKTVYGYSFWVRLNSATANNWAFASAVVTDDVLPEEGHEYKHWFGNQAGASGGKSSINNFTSKLAVGTWHKITVVMDQKSGFNMYQDKWIWQYDSGAAFRGDFHQNKAQKIQWGIPLQHQIGAGVRERSGDPYDITNGSYNFDVDFYGLELLK